MVKRVAVIGAGASGLTSIKCCLDEGLEPVCYEKSDSIAGIWNYTDEPKPMQATVYRYVRNNFCSKDIGAKYRCVKTGNINTPEFHK